MRTRIALGAALTSLVLLAAAFTLGRGTSSHPPERHGGLTAAQAARRAAALCPTTDPATVRCVPDEDAWTCRADGRDVYVTRTSAASLATC